MPFDLSDDEPAVAPPAGRHLRRFAVIIGIDDYANGIPPLETAVADARAVARVLIREHECRVLLLTRLATAGKIGDVVGRILPAWMREEVAFLFYFAGHGMALPSETGPRGYLVPAGATRDPKSFVKMGPLHAAVCALPCRHVLAILDCCFAGSFRWGAALGDRRLVPDFMFRRTCELYLEGRARQVLVSAAADQRALELLTGEEIRGRAVTVGAERHSPFASALLSALSGRGPLGKGGVLTVTELSEYLRRQVEALSEAARRRQTPQLWPLDGHDKGEFLFRVPGQPLALAENPRLTSATNPYRGLRAYEAEDASVFHGRANAIAALLERTSVEPLVVMLGESGSGKSSLLRAGLLPHWEKKGWKTLLVPDLSAGGKLRPLRPGNTPLAELSRLPSATGAAPPSAGHPLVEDWLAQQVKGWLADLPSDLHLLLCVDQFEELVTLGREVGQDTREQDYFQAQLAAALALRDPRLHVLIALRSDYVADVSGGPLNACWRREALLPVPLITPTELRQIVLLPAASVALDFADSTEVDFLVAEVNQTSNPLPILSCALSELYESYVAANDGTRSLKLPANFAQVGGVAGSLGRSGDQLREQFPDVSHRAMLDIILLRFVALEGGRPARRRVLKEELAYPPPADAVCRVLIEELEERRLLVAGQTEAGVPFWELCHDRLLTGWAHCRALVQNRQEEILLQRRLASDLAARAAHTRLSADTHLWDREPRLPQVRALLEKEPGRAPCWLNSAEREFVKCSARVSDRNRRRRWRLAGEVIVSLAILTAIALYQRAQSDERAKIAKSRQLAAQAQTFLDDRLDLALLLSVEAHRIAPTAEARSVLLRTLQHSPHLRAFLPGHQGLVNSVAISRDGHILATTSEDGAVRLWDLATRRPMGNPLTGHTGEVRAVAFSPDGKILASAGRDGDLRLWDAKDFSPLGETLHADLGEAHYLAFAPDSSSIAVGYSKTVCLWDIAKRKQVGDPFTGHTEPVRLLAFSPDGKTLVSSGVRESLRKAVKIDGKDQVLTIEEDSVILWDVATHQTKALLGEGKPDAFSAAFSPDGKTLAVGTGIDVNGPNSHAVYLWDVAKRQVIGEPLKGHTGFVEEVAFSPDGKTLASASSDGTVRLWGVQGREAIGEPLRGHTGSVNGLAWNADGTTLVSSALNGTVIVWHIGESQRLRLPPRSAGVMSETVAFSADSKLLAADTGNGGVGIWNTASGEREVRLPLGQGSTSSLAFDPKGALLAGGVGGDVLLWDLPSRKPLGPPLEGPRGTIKAVAFHPEGGFLVSGATDKTVRVWDLSSHREHRSPLTHSSSVQCLAFDPHGSLLAVGGKDPHLSLWRWPDCVPARAPINTGEKQILGVAFSPDGRMLATCGAADRTILWDVKKGVRIATLIAADRRPVWSTAFSPDGSILATAGQDTRINLWDVASRQRIGEPLIGRSRFVSQVAFSPNGKYIASAGDQGSGSLWDAAPASWEKLAAATANRNLTRAEWNQFIGPEIPYQKTVGATWTDEKDAGGDERVTEVISIWQVAILLAWVELCLRLPQRIRTVLLARRFAAGAAVLLVPLAAILDWWTGPLWTVAGRALPGVLEKTFVLFLFAGITFLCAHFQRQRDAAALPLSKQ